MALTERLLTLRGLPSDSTYVLNDEPGELDIKKREPGILFISLSHCFTIQTSDYGEIFDFVLIQHHKRCN